MAVVKADGYGHGALEVARAALEAGASWVGVALVEEGIALRRAGIAAPILVLSECPSGAEGAALDARLSPSLHTEGGLTRLAEAAQGRSVGVHVKVDTGMHRAGVWPPEDVAGFVGRVVAAGLTLDGLWTHLAASAEDQAATEAQLGLFAAAVERVRAEGFEPSLLHAANTGGVMLHPASHLDLVRTGIGIYGLEPAVGVGSDLGSGRHSPGGRSSRASSPSPPGNASRMGSAIGWTATRWSPPCRSGTRTDTLGGCRRARTS